MAALKRRLGDLPPMAGGGPETSDEYRARNEEITERLNEIHEAARGRQFSDEETDEWNRLNAERDANVETIQQIETRDARIAELAGDERNVEREPVGASFQTARPGVARGDDIYDLSTVRRSFGNPEGERTELHDRALRSVEAAVFHQDRAVRTRELQQGHLERLLEADASGELAQRILRTGSPVYKRAFGKYLQSPIGGFIGTNEERTALSYAAGAQGGYGIVYTLDPTLLLTSNSTVNPMRAISNVETISGTNEWRGLTSAGVSATRRAEATETTDASPTFGQPALIVTKADVTIPFSIEIGQDFANLQGQLATMIQDAKDDEEAASFVTGVGTTVFPQGVLVGATTTVAAASGATIVVGDIYKAWEAVPPRFRPRASWIGNLFIYDKIRQFDTAGGASLFVDNLRGGFSNQGAQSFGGGSPSDANLGYQLLMRPAYEASAMAAATTNGTKMLCVGDFSYYKIIDRTGIDIEVIPHIFGTTYPIGQRAVYAYWRNFGKVLDVNAFRVLTATT